MTEEQKGHEQLLSSLKLATVPHCTWTFSPFAWSEMGMSPISLANMQSKTVWGLGRNRGEPWGPEKPLAQNSLVVFDGPAAG